MKTSKPIMLVILDGFGKNPSDHYNAVELAKKPYFDSLIQKYPNGLIRTDGLNVGLPEGQMGNSEVGHTNIGAGRVVYQELTRIDKSIQDGSFFQNQVLIDGILSAIKNNKSVHIFGLLSDGGVHSHQKHIKAGIELAVKNGAKNVYLHAFLDGRDTAPRSAKSSIEYIEQVFSELKIGRIATIIGRYYSMDRDNRWDRVEQAYDLVCGTSSLYQVNTAIEGLEMAYKRDENDEFVKATQIGDNVKIEDGDSILFLNFRSDRAREISYPFVQNNFAGFQRKSQPKLSSFVTLTKYADSIAAPIAFPPQSLENVLGKYLEFQKKTQLRIAETEKYPHVTFFFSGGREEPFVGEERILVPSPKVATYDLKPEMSAFEIADRLDHAIKGGKFDFIVVNFANGDMVGHTGSLDAAIKAVETLDKCLEKVIPNLLDVGGEALITADHGNAEKMIDETTGQPHTAHTTFPVSVVYVGSKKVQFREGGVLADLAPTLLNLMNLEQPKEMTGKNLFK